MKRSRIAGLGRPLILTTAAFAPMAACGQPNPLGDGSEVDQMREQPASAGDGWRDMPPVGSGERPDSPDLPPRAPPTTQVATTECPAEVPAYAERCNGPGWDCDYGDCGGWPTITASCVDGAWEVLMSSCNPPAPEPCPGAEPRLGDACGPTEPATCTYGDTCPSIYECGSMGRWLLVPSVSCNPPPVDPDYDAGTDGLDPDADAGW